MNLLDIFNILKLSSVHNTKDNGQQAELYQQIAGKVEIPASSDAITALKDFKLLYPKREHWRLFVDGLYYANPEFKRSHHDINGWKKFKR